MSENNPALDWPSTDELPDSDDTPIDNQLQHLIPSLLEETLAIIWADRMDWFFGVKMGIFYDPDKSPLVPEGFLSLGVERVFDEKLRNSYAVWEENAVPILMLEVVSRTYRGEYSDKKTQYAELGVLYYVIYSYRRRRNPRLEVNRLVDGVYVPQQKNPLWLPEIGLGIGAERGNYHGITREWLYWYDEQEKRFLTPEERIQQAENLAQQQRQRAERLASQLRALGIDPDSLTENRV